MNSSLYSTACKRAFFLLLCTFGLIYIVSICLVHTVQAEQAETSELIHEVKSGDTLWGIAQTYKMDVKELQDFNQLDSDMIYIGQKLSIPQYPSDAENYIVQSGDSLWKIAHRFDIDLAVLQEANQLNTTILQIGQVITIPTEPTTLERETSIEKEESTVIDSEDREYREQTETNLTIDRLKRPLESWSKNQSLFTASIPYYAHSQWQKDMTREVSRKYPEMYYSGLGYIGRVNPLYLSNFQENTKLDHPSSEKNSTLKVSSVHAATGDKGNLTETNVEVELQSNREKIEDKTEDQEWQVSEVDLEWLAKIIEAEAEGEPYLGKVAVGSVVINRLEDDWFPDTIKDVIFQKVNKVYQFSPVGNGRINKVTPSEDSYEAAREALAGEDPTEGALYFYNSEISNDQWIRTRTVVKQIGQHKFAY